MARPRALLLATSAAVLASVVHAQGAVWIVDDDAGPGVDFTDLQAAIDAAASGDVLLLRDGTYGSDEIRFTIAAKSLALIADAGAAPVLSSGVEASELPAGGRVTVAGLDVQAEVASAMHAYSCDGLVWVEGCTLQGGGGNSGAKLTASAACVLVDCTLRGGDAQVHGQSGPVGLSVALSAAYVFGCDVRGGLGKPYPSGSASSGDGAYVHSSGSMFAERSSFVGADDPDPTCSVPIGHCDPGDGIHAPWGGVTLVDCTVQAGVPACDCCDGFDTFGQVTFLPGVARALDVDSPLREGETIQVDVEAEPGDLALLVIGDASAQLLVPQWSGTVLIPAPLQVVTLGVVPASGAVSASFVAPNLGPGVDAAFVDLQLGVLAADLSVVVGEPARLLLLDAAL